LDINWVNLGWTVGVILLSNLAVLYTGYRYYIYVVNGIEYMMNDIRILHCESCGRGEIVSSDVEELKTCGYCNPKYCEEHDTYHRIIDKGYKPRTDNKIKSRKKYLE
jgi:hypothetical protein